MPARLQSCHLDQGSDNADVTTVSNLFKIELSRLKYSDNVPVNNLDRAINVIAFAKFNVALI